MMMGRNCFSPLVHDDIRYLIDNNLVLYPHHFNFTAGHHFPNATAEGWGPHVYIREKPGGLYFVVKYRKVTIGMCILRG